MDKKFPDICIGWAWVFTLIDKQNYRLPYKISGPSTHSSSASVNPQFPYDIWQKALFDIGENLYSNSSSKIWMSYWPVV